MNTVDIITSVRSIWNKLSPEERQDLFNTITDLRRAAALKEAATYQDPMCRAFAEQLAPAGSSPAISPITPLPSTPSTPAIDI